MAFLKFQTRKKLNEFPVIGCRVVNRSISKNLKPTRVSGITRRYLRCRNCNSVIRCNNQVKHTTSRREGEICVTENLSIRLNTHASRSMPAREPVCAVF